MSAALLGNPSVIGRSRPGLSDARVEAEVADELLRLLEAPNLADRRHDGEQEECSFLALDHEFAEFDG